MAKKVVKEENGQNIVDKQKALETAIALIKKDCGNEAIIKLGEQTKLQLDAISTGSLGLDMALGIGGLPKGRVIEIFGPESSGKTTIALHAVAEAQKKGGIAAFIDAEHALDPIYAKGIGVDIDNLLLSQPDNGEQALEIAEKLVSSGAIDIIVIDSVAALVPKAEIEGAMGDSHVGLQARLMSQALRKLSGVVSKTKCVIIFINQLREKVGVMYGNPETTPGGKALKFYASVRIDVRKSETLKNGADAYGNHVKCKVVKNKVAPPFKVAEFDIIFGKGISKSSEIIDAALEYNLIEKSGAWYSYNGEKFANGKENAKKYFEENPDLMEALEEEIKQRFENGESGEKEENVIPDDFDLSSLELE